MKRYWLVRAAVVSSLVSAGVACSRGVSSYPSSGATSVSASVRVAVTVLSTDASFLRQRWVLFMAQQVLVADCMTGHGLTYMVANPGAEPTLGTMTADAVGHGVPATYGIAASLPGLAGGAGEASVSTAVPAEDRYVRGLSTSEQAGYLLALAGPADALEALTLPSGQEVNFRTGGCVGQARATLFGEVQTALLDTLLPQDVERSFGLLLPADAPYQSALSAWQVCMVRRGLRYSSPQAAIGYLSTGEARMASVQSLRAREMVVAAADLACDTTSGLRRTRRAELTNYVQGLSSTLLGKLATVRSARGKALQLAATILAAQSGG